MFTTTFDTWQRSLDMGIASIGSGNAFQRWNGRGAGRVVVRIGIAVVGLSAIIASATGVAQAAAGTHAAPAALPLVGALAAPPTLSASSVSASRTIGVDFDQLRSNTTYELISRKTRTDPSSTEVSVSEKLTVLAQVKTDARGKSSTRFVVPLRWRHDHLIEVWKAKGADLVEGTNDWLTVTAPQPSLALSSDKVDVHADPRFRVVVSGLRAHAKYVLFSNKSRRNAASVPGGSSDPGTLRSVRTDANGRALVTITIPDTWTHDHLIEVEKVKGQTLAVGANAWLTVVRWHHRPRSRERHLAEPALLT
jgi:hypothetical protein